MVKIISDDTDVFVLACNDFRKMDVIVLMEATKSDRTVTNIGAIVRKHKLTIKLLLANHTLSGCDTVCHYQGTDNKILIKVLEKQSLKHLLDPLFITDEEIAETTRN